MMSDHREWKFYFPEDGETIADACPIIGRIFDADHAAREACEYDYHGRDGWERIEVEFPIVVVSPDGEETRFIGCHERSIEHAVREAKP
jgi:hypothetical protein